MLWMTWRQHRLAIIATTAATAVLVAILFVILGHIEDVGTACSVHDCWLGVASALGSTHDLMNTVLFIGLPSLGGIFAVFWGAPLLSREYEVRTHVFAWTQDCSPRRWLVTKVALLAAVVVVLSGVAGFAAQQVHEALMRANFDAFGPYVRMDLQPGLQIGYALFGLALGVTVGSLVRHVVPAMAVTAVLFAFVRVVVVRTYWEWLPPLQSFDRPDPHALLISTMYQNSEGGGFPEPPAPCPWPLQESCLSAHGIKAWYLFQPADRLLTLQLMQLGLYLALAAGLFALAWYRLRRSVQVG